LFIKLIKLFLQQISAEDYYWSWLQLFIENRVFWLGDAINGHNVCSWAQFRGSCWSDNDNKQI